MVDNTKKTNNTPETQEKGVTKSLRRKVWWRMNFEQAGWNYEGMHNIGFAYMISPVIKNIYKTDADRAAALKRHLLFFNTHPYVAAPIMGVTLAMEEARSNGQDIDDASINAVKVGMMGPLAGVGDPIFWGTLRPVLGAFAASFAMEGNIFGPIIFFVVWNIIRLAFLWYTQEIGYRQGTNIASNLQGGLLQKVTYAASILGMFIMGVLVPRWTTMKFPKVLSEVKTQDSVIKPAAEEAGNLLNTIQGSGDSTSKLDALDKLQNLVTDFPGITSATTVQNVLDELIPGLAPLLMLFLTLWLLKKNVKPIWIILGYFVLGVLAYVGGVLGL